MIRAWIAQCTYDQCPAVTVITATRHTATTMIMTLCAILGAEQRVAHRMDMRRMIQFVDTPCVRVYPVGKRPVFPPPPGIAIIMEEAFVAMGDDAIGQCPPGVIFCARDAGTLERAQRLGIPLCYVDKGG